MDLRRKTKELDDGPQYFYPKYYLADYDSMVYQTNIENLDTDEYGGSIYKYLKDNPQLAKLYYTALGRERHSLYRTNKNVDIQNYIVQN